MELFKGKSTSERNKIIAAIVLGALAVAALLFAFGPGFFSKSSTTTASSSSSPTPKPTASPSVVPGQFQMPSESTQLFDYQTTPVVYSPGDYGAPDPGRNIFAFYEPPPPTPWSPTPFVPPPTPKPPTPTPTPPYLIAFLTPQRVYAGSPGFRLEVNGDMFTPDAKVYFNQALLPTSFVNPQRLTADVQSNMISGEGSRQIIIQSSDGTKYSLPVMLNVQAPPKPQLLYVGVKLPKLGNNATAFFQEASKMNTPGAVPLAKRLNDEIEDRFKLVSISTKEVVLEDTKLPFRVRHTVPFHRPAAGSSINTGPGGTGFPTRFPTTGSPGGFPVNTRPGSVPGFPGVTMPAPRPADSNSNRPRREERPVKGEDHDDDDDPK